MTRQKRLTILFVLLLQGTTYAGIGWEKSVMISPTTSFQPAVYLNGKEPIVTYEKKEGDGVYLNILSVRSGLSERYLLGNTENFYEYDLLVSSNRISILYATASNLNLIIKDTISGSKSISSVAIDNAHGPSFYYNPKTSTSLVFFDRIQNGRHGLHLLPATMLSNAKQLTNAKLVLNEADTNLRGSFFPHCAFDDKNTFLVFSKRKGSGIRQNDAVYLMNSKDNGATWTPAREVSLKGSDASFPWITVPAPGKLIISYIKSGPDNRTDPVILISSNNSPDIRASVFTNFMQMLFFPRTFLMDDTLKLFAYDYSRDNRAVIFEQTLQSKTSTWADLRTISQTNANALNYKMVHEDRKIYVTWQDDKGAVLFAENDTTAPAPQVFSTEIDPDYEYAGVAPDLQWKTVPDVSGIRGYAYVLDMIPNSIPDIENVSADIGGKTFNSVDDGIWYFHIRSIDQIGNWSDTTHFSFIVNTLPLTLPRILSSTHKEFEPSQKRDIHLSWTMESEKRKIIGYSYLLSTRSDLEPEEKINTTETNIFFKDIKPGTWRFTIKACDQERRWSPFVLFTINIEAPLITVTEADYQKAAAGEFTEQESAITYTVGKGEILSRIIQKVLGLKPHQDFKDYLKEVVKFNDIQNPDNIQPDNKVHIPIIIADQETDLDTIAETIFGNPRARSKLVIQNSNSTNEVKIGDKILIRDKYFLKTGHLQKRDEEKIKSSGLKFHNESTNIQPLMNTPPEESQKTQK